MKSDEAGLIQHNQAVFIDGEWSEPRMEVNGWSSHCAAIDVTVRAHTLQLLKEAQEAAVSDWVEQVIDAGVAKNARPGQTEEWR